jgi:hypothetical protein
MKRQPLRSPTTHLRTLAPISISPVGNGRKLASLMQTGSISHNDADYSKFLQSLLATKCQVSRHSKGGRIPEALGIAGGKATFFLKVAGKAGRMEPPFAHQ